MPRSKLEKYLSVLEALVARPLKFEKVSYEAKIDCTTLKQHMDFLVFHKLVEERNLTKGKAVYAITERGLAVFKTLRAQRYLQKLKKIMPVVEEASEVQSLLSRSSSPREDEG
jgi:predicted transcriptional regulator